MSSPTSTTGTSAPTRRFRTDIEGLRGFAIALVVVFHVFIGRVSSGVDVFLLLGGIFFFSGQLNNALNPKGQTLVQSFIRIIRRLYPHLVVVVALTLAGGLTVLSKLQHSNLAHDAVASLGYFQNWALANSDREYSSIQEQVSPYQHLWSMAVQFQIYVGSLLFIWLFVLLVRRHPRPIFTTTLTIATLASFIYATWLHIDDQTLNYYSTFSRFWEIGLGGLLGMIITSRRGRTRKDGSSALMMAHAPRWTRWVLGIGGVCGIVFTGLFLDGAHQFPGPWTLVPLGGTVLIVLAGTGTEYETAKTSGEAIGVNRLLETAPFQFFGRISYGLYLWHWPLLVLALNFSGDAKVSPALGVGVIVASIGLAWGTQKIIEKPLRQEKKPERSWVKLFGSFKPKQASIAGVLAAVTVAVMFVPHIVDSRKQSEGDILWELASDTRLYPGARVFTDGAQSRANQPLVPPLEDFDALTPQTVADGCAQGFTEPDIIKTQKLNESDVPCAYGDVNSKNTMYLVGASHSEHFLPALDAIAESRGVKLIPLLKMACPLNMDQDLPDGSDNPSCRQWNKDVMDFIQDNPPTDGIFMTGTRPTGVLGEGPEIVPDEYVEAVEKFDSWGIHTYLIRDNVWFMNGSQDAGGQQNMRTCVSDMVEGKRAEHDAGSEFAGVADEMAVTQEEIDQINSVCGNTVSDRLSEVNPATGAPTDPLAWGAAAEVAAADAPVGGAVANDKASVDGADDDASASDQALSTTETDEPETDEPETDEPEIKLQANTQVLAQSGLTATGYVDSNGNRYYVDGSSNIYYTSPDGSLYKQDAYGNATLVSSGASNSGAGGAAAHNGADSDSDSADSGSADSDRADSAKTSATPTATPSAKADEEETGASNKTGTPTPSATKAPKKTTKKTPQKDAANQPVRDPGTPALPNDGAYKGLSVTNLDITSAFCRDGWCPGVIGGMVVYRDAHHFTNVFARSLAREIERQMYGSATVE